MKQIIFLISFLFSISLVGQRTQVTTTIMGADTVLYKATYHDVYTLGVDSIYQLDTSIMIHFDAEYPRPFPDTIEHALTFANGVTRTVNFVRNDLITGKSGGQTVVGGTASGDDLTISSTTNGTKGNINFGTSTYDEVNNKLGIGTTSPAKDLTIEKATSSTLRLSTTNDPANYYSDIISAYDGANSFRIQHGGVDLFHATQQGYGAITVGNGGSKLVLKPVTSESYFDGKLGIGITNPSQSLTVSSPTTYEGILVKGNVAPNISFVQNAGTTPAYKVGLSGNDGTALSISSGAAATDLVHIKSDGKVGIGTTSPSSTLHVNGNGLRISDSSAGRDLIIEPSLGGAVHTFKSSNTAAGYAFANNSSEFMRITSAGLVGIGTASPNQKLSILRSDAGWLAGFGANGVQDLLKIGYGDTYTSGETTLEGSVYGAFALRTQNNRHLLLVPNGTGKVGINNTSPTAELDIRADFAAGANVDAIKVSTTGHGGNVGDAISISFDATATPVARIQSVVSSGSYDLAFQTGATIAEKMRIMANGNVGIGTASPSAALDVVGNIALSGDIKSTGKVGAGTASPDRTLHTIDATALTNTITYPLRVSHATSGTPAISFGVGIESELENASGTDKVASAITTVWADPTNGTEDASMQISLMKNGTLTGGAVFDNDGNVLVKEEAYGVSWSGSKEAPTKDDLYTKIEDMYGEIQDNILSAIYPVGSLYTSTLSTNPGTLLGIGTWVAFGAGKVMVGIDAGQTEFDTVEETGGAKTHTLTEAEMPAHTHTISSTTADGGGTNIVDMGVTASGSVTTGSTGGGGAHNNLQPYIVVYMWKRTS